MKQDWEKEAIFVRVEMQCELGEKTGTKLMEMRAHCVEETTITECYYDTESFLLASTQTWLSQHDGHWRLILEQSPDHSEPNKTKRSEKDQDGNEMLDNPTPSARAGKQGNAESKRAPTTQIKDPGETSSQSQSQVQDPCTLCAFSGRPRYTELTDHISIIKQLAQSLSVSIIPREIQHLSIESFLETAKIQIYDSWIRSRKVKYSLPNACSLVVETNFNFPSAAPSAVLIMNADVLNISTELEKMDRLCTQLDLKIKP
ncbi:uncharacterized protein si:dkey-191c17.2 [Pygocentrus nattereri]|uniref:uncharacterized protein si:dkey-191c17.2 n=1 Tax=Pygocentrus nattereri TaxID=42514 RepID=UPI0008144285|nr:uncharacterized protein si:dkey-191c17.2 [Pygocentrus nattereri]